MCVCVHVCLSLFLSHSLLLSLLLPFLSHILTHVYRCGIVVCFFCQAKMLSSLCDPLWCYLTSVCVWREWASAKPSSLPECCCKDPGWQRGLKMSSRGLSTMSKIDRQDNIVHLHRHIHTYAPNIHTEMYTGNYRKVYQSAGISPMFKCVWACHSIFACTPLQGGNRDYPPYFHCLFFFLGLFPTPNLFVLSLSCFSFVCLLVCECCAYQE